MKQSILTFFGIIGAAIANIFGGWTSALTTLVIFMAIDYLTGIIVAGVFHASKKTETGALKSSAGFKGLCRKGIILLVVLVAYRLDLLIGTQYIKDAVVIGFCANEALSILENITLCGVPVPSVITKALDILNKKGDTEDGN